MGVFAAADLSARAAVMLVEANFNDSDGLPTLANSGTLGGTFGTVNTVNYSSTTPPSNDGLGYSGDFTSIPRPAVTLANNAGLQNLLSFTISGWILGYPVATSPQSPVIVDNRVGTSGFSLQVVSANAAQQRLRLAVDGATVDSPNGSMTNTAWRFFAVTYDGSVAANNVRFYVGDGTTLSQVGSTLTLNQGAAAAHAGDLFIGRSRNANTATAGYMDNVRIFGSQADNSGVLTLSELNYWMNQPDAVVPEPGTAALLLVGWSLCVAARRFLHGGLS
jgi:hypothetical protein